MLDEVQNIMQQRSFLFTLKHLVILTSCSVCNFNLMFQSVNDNFISQFSHGTVCTNKFNYLGPPKITEGGPFDPHWPISKINPAFCLPVPTLVLQSHPHPPPPSLLFPTHIILCSNASTSFTLDQFIWFCSWIFLLQAPALVLSQLSPPPSFLVPTPSILSFFRCSWRTASPTFTCDMIIFPTVPLLPLVHKCHFHSSVP